jgi:hypothetical protein
MSKSPRAEKRWVLAVAAVGLAGLGYLLVDTWSRSDKPSGQDGATVQTVNKRPGSRPARPRLQPTSRPATGADIPSTPEEARARPEVSINQSMNKLRQLFAAGQHTEVIATAEAILDSDADRHQVRAYLAMAHCSKGDAERAQVEVDRLPDNRKSMVGTKCKSVGITLRVGSP